MKIKETKVYAFDELSPKAKEKALNEYRNHLDFDFLEDEMNWKFEELLTKYKITEKENANVLYSLSCSQGDGVCFTGRFKWKYYNIKITHSGNYSHNHSVDFDVSMINGNDLSDEKHDDVLEQFKNVFYKLTIELEKYGYAVIEAEESDDAITERFNEMENEYEFLENGDRF